MSVQSIHFVSPFFMNLLPTFIRSGYSAVLIWQKSSVQKKLIKYFLTGLDKLLKSKLFVLTCSYLCRWGFQTNFCYSDIPQSLDPPTYKGIHRCTSDGFHVCLFHHSGHEGVLHNSRLKMEEKNH